MPVTALSQGIALIVSKEVSQNRQLKAPVNDMLPNSRIEFQQQWLGLLQLDPCYGSFQASIDEKHGALFCRHSWSEKNDN